MIMLVVGIFSLQHEVPELKKGKLSMCTQDHKDGNFNSACVQLQIVKMKIFLFTNGDENESRIWFLLSYCCWKFQKQSSFRCMCKYFSIFQQKQHKNKVTAFTFSHSHVHFSPRNSYLLTYLLLSNMLATNFSFLLRYTLFLCTLHTACFIFSLAAYVRYLFSKISCNVSCNNSLNHFARCVVISWLLLIENQPSIEEVYADETKLLDFAKFLQFCSKIFFKRPQKLQLV